MKKLQYIVYVTIVIIITVVAGAEDPDARDWGGSSGRSGWSSSGGHK